jgi:Domain of unknown function (DUF1918)
MPVKVGDEIVVDPTRPGTPRPEGEILDILESGGVVHYRVRWDEGHESVFFPSSDAHVVSLRPRP